MGSKGIYEQYDKAADLLKFLTSSNVRTGILLSLNESPKNLSDLKQELDLESSTLIHGTNKLEKRDFIFKDGENYNLSQTGKIFALKLVNLIKTVETVKSQEKLWSDHKIEGIPEDLLLKIGDLNDSTIVEAESTHLTKVLDYFTQLLISSKIIKGVSPIFHPYLPKAVESAVSNGAHVQIIVTEDILEVLNKSNPEILTKVPNNFELYVIREEVREAFTVTENCISFGLFNKNGMYDFNIDLHSESKEAIEWTKKLFEYYLKRSERII
ncbi:MAG: transcriptional regulator FilR1 domain-containing protein [Methanobacterium sp.]